jgi:3-dehydroquinate dehydratase-1
MICVSISCRGLAACRKALEGVKLAEIRLDLCGLGEKEAGRLFSSARAAGKKLIATCRPGRLGREAAERKALLLAAIGAGASFVDVELEAPPAFRKEIERMARAKGCTVIISHHDYRGTPPEAGLKRIVARCLAAGADMAKVACTPHSGADNARLLGLLGSGRKLVVIGMGPKGRITRVAAPLLGSPFTYASAGRGKETAGGQMTKRELERIFRMLGAKHGTGCRGLETGSRKRRCA